MHAENGCQHEQGARLAVQRTDAKLSAQRAMRAGPPGAHGVSSEVQS